ncbi:VWA domain-containing protein [bacterium]|nr:VWA domain-containing protein [bacterium]
MKGLTLLAPDMLWLFLLLPVFAMLQWRGNQQRLRNRERFCDPGLFRDLNPILWQSKIGVITAQGVFLMAVGFIVLGLCRPAGNPRWEKEVLVRRGVDIMLLVDLSASMKATDLKPSRMQAVKTAVKYFINQLSNDRVGLTIFAGSVSLQSPLTMDYGTVKMMVDIINTDFMPKDGTALGSAINFALEKIDEHRRKNAVMILLTDGENTCGQSPPDAATKARQAGTRIFTIGVGTPEGAMIPEGVDKQGNPVYKRRKGEPVITRLDTGLLRDIATQTKGKYYAAETHQALQDAYTDISRLTKTGHTEKVKKIKYQEYYVWFVLLSFILLLTAIGLEQKWIWDGIKKDLLLK